MGNMVSLDTTKIILKKIDSIEVVVQTVIGQAYGIPVQLELSIFNLSR